VTVSAPNPDMKEKQEPPKESKKPKEGPCGLPIKCVIM
jgi:hypothetical protein